MTSDRRDFLKTTLAAGAGAAVVAATAVAGEGEGAATGAPARERVVVCSGDSNTWGFVPQFESGKTRFTRYG
ncbi:MAG: twin-arginine translocation signal domain-containing protein, partial [Gammaproteobacteria bacterium]